MDFFKYCLFHDCVAYLRYTELFYRVRKQSETAVDKASRLLADWRATEAKGKKHSHSCARENEKLQDAAVLDTTKYGKQT